MEEKGKGVGGGGWGGNLSSGNSREKLIISRHLTGRVVEFNASTAELDEEGTGIIRTASREKDEKKKKKKKKKGLRIRKSWG